MVFSSLIFIFRFMILFFSVYYVAPARMQNAVLFAGSLFFYAWGELRYLVLILLSVCVNYFFGRVIGRGKSGPVTGRNAYGKTDHGDGTDMGTGGGERGRKRAVWLTLAVLYNLGILFLFKYADFFLGSAEVLFRTELPAFSVPLPLGISFYTFQILSYVIDVYRGRVEPARSFLKLGTYLCMFPQLIAGPIVLYGDIGRELDERTVSLRDIEEGLKEFTLGLGSKVLLANQVGSLWNELAQAGYDGISSGAAWLGVLAFSLQIYFDFNGYSLMAIGLGRMMGFRLPVNFDYPYMSRSVTEFWRRWHITLSSWFRDYLYIPLGGSRKGPARTVLNLSVVWLATGLWHGASWNFILWGVYYFLFLAAEKLFWMIREKHGKRRRQGVQEGQNPPHGMKGSRILGRIYTLLVVGVGWILFALTGFGDLKGYFSTLFSLTGGSDWLYYISRYGMILAAGVFFAGPLFRRWFEKRRDKWSGILSLLAIFWLSVYLLVDSAYNPFLYFYF